MTVWVIETSLDPASDGIEPFRNVSFVGIIDGDGEVIEAGMLGIGVLEDGDDVPDVGVLEDAE